MNEDTQQRDEVLRQLPPARYQALRQVFAGEADIDARIVEYLHALEHLTVPSDAELQEMQRRGELPSDEELAALDPVDPDNPPLTGKEVWGPGQEHIQKQIAKHKARVAARKREKNDPGQNVPQ